MAAFRGLPHGVDADEAVADFTLAATSRAIDDREISLQKQSKVFFEISGAGHEALGVGLARHLRPAHDEVHLPPDDHDVEVDERQPEPLDQFVHPQFEQAVRNLHGEGVLVDGRPQCGDAVATSTGAGA